MEWELDCSEVEGFSCQAIIINYNAHTSNLIELVLLNPSLKGKSIHSEVRYTPGLEAYISSLWHCR